MTVTRSPRGNVNEMHASHEVMELVRGNSVLSVMVMQMREAGLSWRNVKTAIEAEMVMQMREAGPSWRNVKTPIEAEIFAARPTGALAELRKESLIVLTWARQARADAEAARRRAVRRRTIANAAVHSVIARIHAIKAATRETTP